MTPTEGFFTLDAAYEWNADVIECRSCKRRQQITWRHQDFQHRSGCAHEASESKPWLKLRDLIAVLDAPLPGQGPAPVNVMLGCPFCPTPRTCLMERCCHWKNATGHIPMPGTDAGWTVTAPWLGFAMAEFGVTKESAIARAERSRNAAIADLMAKVAAWRAVELVAVADKAEVEGEA